MAARRPRPVRGGPRPPQQPPPAWIAATAERHRVGRAVPDPDAPAAARWTTAAALYHRPGELDTPTPGTERMPLAAQAAAAELMTIRGNLGLSAAAFEPTRHTMVIEGRPVQVPAHTANMQDAAAVPQLLGALWGNVGHGRQGGIAVNVTIVRHGWVGTESLLSVHVFRRCAELLAGRHTFHGSTFTARAFAAFRHVH